MQNLLRPPSRDVAADLEKAMAAIVGATPLNTAHARDLPNAVRDLSRMLTQERAHLASPYWIHKRLLTAYCRYFLPWNLVRLAWLLPNLGLSVNAHDTVLDLGSGPLTLPLALWVALPHWRNIPLTVICGDIAPGPLDAGREIFRRLAPDSPWKIELKRGPMHALLRSFSGKAALVGACNVLNEGRPSRDQSLEDRMAELPRLVAAKLAPHGAFLAMEPGTRLGGKLMATLRHASFASSLVPQAPCPHWAACPMLRERATGWCHFSHTTDAAPTDLSALTGRAGLAKKSLSLSCLLLRPASDEERMAARSALPETSCEPEDDMEDMDDVARYQDARNAWAAAFAGSRHDSQIAKSFVRILSDPIRLPEDREPARYACSQRGMALVRNALRMPSGAALEVRWPEAEARDPKTGALIVFLQPAEHATEKKGTPKRPAKSPARTDRSRKTGQDDGPPAAGRRASQPGRHAPRREPESGNSAKPRPGGERKTKRRNGNDRRE